MSSSTPAITIVKSTPLEERIGASYSERKLLSEADRRAFESRDPSEIKTVAERQVLRVIMGQSGYSLDYDQFYRKHIVGSLQDLVRGGKIPGALIALHADKPEEIPTFSWFKLDKLTSKTVRGQGWLAEVVSALDRDTLARTFVSKFADQKKFDRAYKASEYLTYLQQAALDPSKGADNPILASAFARFDPVHVRAATKDLILATSFVDAKDLHDELTEIANPGERAEYVREVSDLLLGVSIYGEANKSRCTSGAMRRSWLGDKDHEQHIVEKLYGLVDDRFRGESGQFDLGLLRHHMSSPDFETKLPEVAKRYVDVKTFHDFWMENVVRPMDKSPLIFSHGDALPTNVMVQHDKNLEAKHGTDRKYSLVDMEFAGRDYIQNQFVQLYAKAGIFDWDGSSYAGASGGSIEDALLEVDHSRLGIFARDAGLKIKEEDYDSFRDTYARLKVENYMAWATRYHQLPKVVALRNEAQSMEMSRYYYTLAVEEMKKLGMFEDWKTCNALEYTNKIFGTPYDLAKDKDKMMRIHAELHPHHSTVSFFDPEDMFDPESQLEDMIYKMAEKDRKKRRKSWLVNTGIALAGLTLLGAVAFLGSREYDQLRQDEIVEQLSGHYETFDPTSVWRVDIDHDRMENVEAALAKVCKTKRDDTNAGQFSEPQRQRVYNACTSPQNAIVVYRMGRTIGEGLEVVQLLWELSGEKYFWNPNPGEGYAPYLPQTVAASIASQINPDNWALLPMEDGRSWRTRQLDAIEAIAKSDPTAIHLRQINQLSDQDRIILGMKVDDDYTVQTRQRYRELGRERGFWHLGLSRGEQVVKPGVTRDAYVKAAEGLVHSELVKAIIDQNERHNPFEGYRMHMSHGEMNEIAIEGFEGFAVLDPDLRIGRIYHAQGEAVPNLQGCYERLMSHGELSAESIPKFGDFVVLDPDLRIDRTHPSEEELTTQDRTQRPLTKLVRMLEDEGINPLNPTAGMDLNHCADESVSYRDLDVSRTGLYNALVRYLSGGHYYEQAVSLAKAGGVNPGEFLSNTDVGRVSLKIINAVCKYEVKQRE
ncbi:hypothetical protein HN419_01150 [Candidatus Woesearchaeota archaeon]|jgi:hypothetical protein|nr:hypothetical protein [Candidatus Woesearchaeota archaeon]MBT3537397.1 hypothetical protein [Candidatus Woesearchaeota archaeon]MBT7106293.1 hypothetical protein [Candidatus Woesearchaeota archaeon]MBT7930809.1 hypothetical protein [Candidatus Woesearchaeota archaeon]